MYSEELFAYCSGQCRASRSHPSICRCICQGRNHGSLLYRQPVNVTPYPYQNPYSDLNREIPQLPEEKLQLIARNIGRELDALPDLSQNGAPETRSSSAAGSINLTKKNGKYRIAKSLGKALKHSISGYSQDDLNSMIVNGLRKQFSQERVDLILQGSFGEYGYRNPDANRPELYELYESGYVDRAVENTGTSWVTGRPKKLNR